MNKTYDGAPDGAGTDNTARVSLGFAVFANGDWSDGGDRACGATSVYS